MHPLPQDGTRYSVVCNAKQMGLHVLVYSCYSTNSTFTGSHLLNGPLAFILDNFFFHNTVNKCSAIPPSSHASPQIIYLNVCLMLVVLSLSRLTAVNNRKDSGQDWMDSPPQFASLATHLCWLCLEPTDQNEPTIRSSDSNYTMLTVKFIKYTLQACSNIFNFCIILVVIIQLNTKPHTYYVLHRNAFQNNCEHGLARTPAKRFHAHSKPNDRVATPSRYQRAKQACQHLLTIRLWSWKGPVYFQQNAILNRQNRRVCGPAVSERTQRP